MTTLKQQTVITTNYVNRFSCIGAECEDDCCHGWSVYVDKPHYKKIKKAMSVDAEQKQMFKDNVKINRGKNSSAAGYAHFVLGEQNKCNFLNIDSLCRLQARHGAEILPNICSVYPRKQIYNGKAFEIYASVSCPEMARLCLLAEDAMYLIESKVDVNNSHIIGVGDSFYAKYYSHIKTTVIELLNPASLTFNQRLFFTIYFAIRTEHDFYKTLEIDPGQKLQQHVEYISKVEVKNEILELIDDIAFSFTNPLKILLDIFINVISMPFVADVLVQGMGAYISQNGSMSMPLGLADIYAQHKERSTRIQAVYGKRLDQYFTNYSMNYWLGDSYIESDDLVIHSRKLLVRITCLRFMLFCHKDIITLLEQEDITGQQDLLDRIAVEVFYKFSRMYEHNPIIIKKIEDDIIKYDYGLPVLASLIKF